ncbi:autotransporter assembly complex protein TamA [Albidovulum aquaemixtae]|uniref:autotransporter assembly complex protein TamA n=1 Tax=Albidovulum aquaemixtae TaxID=1542388 RepID=UPI0015E7F169|nr:autotransporter assembly complex family protein [Defluviimonas aquaemixtae]
MGKSIWWRHCTAAAFLVASLFVLPARALDNMSFVVRGGEDELTESFRAASLLVQSWNDGLTDPQTLFAAARADYGRLVGAAYAEGFYSVVVRIEIDGREAATIEPLDAPAAMREIRVTIEPGPRFTFATARMRPYAPGTQLPPAYGDTKPAFSTAIVDAAEAGVDGWRNVGHAKARVADQSITADHSADTIDSLILLEPGPRVRFGQMTISGAERMRPERIARIAGFPTGETFDPEELDTVANRLRRTGAFRSVALQEAETLGFGDTLDVDLVVAEEALRRFGVGAELSSTEGLNLSGYWLHRNLFGGAERLRVDGAIDRIGGQGDTLGYELGARIERPATPVTDASAFVEARVGREELADITLDKIELSFGLTRVLSDTLSAEAGISYIHTRAEDVTGSFEFDMVALPVSLTWERRDNPIDARKGFYLQADVTPFYGFNMTDSGAQFKADARAYRSFGAEDRLTLAGRVQLGTVVGTSLAATSPDFLFFSGGGGTVRGQPYQSLTVPLVRPSGVTVQTGGLSFAGMSGELRAGITEKIGAVAFYDAGFVSDDAIFGGNSDWHAGAGLGLRYDTGFGPIRLDVGLPVSGTTDDGVQIYVGIGQAF